MLQWLRTKGGWAALAGSGVALLLGAAAPAVRAAEAPTAAAGDTGELTEIIVQARRRSERLEDVPAAITVETGAELAARSATLFEDATRAAPNVLAFASARSVSALEVTMRGQTAIPSSIVYDPAVGLYLDGIYVANGQAAMGTLLDVEDVEIVRGAQGTLFGRNNTGGSILISSRRPDLAGVSGEVSATGGNQDLFAGRAILNLPVNSALGFRFAYQENEHAGWGSSVGSGQSNLMNQHRDQWRAGMLWEPASTVSVYATYERFEANQNGALLHPLPGTLASFYPYPQNVVPDGFYQTDAGSWQHDAAHSDAWQLTANYSASPALTAKLIAGYRELRADNQYDADGMYVPVADVGLTSTSHQSSLELQLSGIAGPVNWVGGLYGFRDSGSADSVLSPWLLPVPPQSGLQALGAPFPTYEQNAVVNQSMAGYLHGEHLITGRWSAAAGVRWTQDRRSLEDNAFYDQSSLGGPPQFCSIAVSSTDPTPLGALSGGPCPALHKGVNYQFWSWELSTRYRFSDQLLAYLRAGRAQRAGGWNIPINTADAQPFRPEQLTDFEAGVKANALDDRLAVNGAVFTGNYDDMQRLLAAVIGGTPTTTVINAGRARVSGLELEGALQLTQAFGVHASIGYTDARYQQFTDLFGNDASGNRFYMTPKYQWSLAGTYTVPTSYGHWLLRADYAWRDGVQFNVINDGNQQGPVGLLNARLALDTLGERLELALFGTNLANKQYAYIGGTLFNPQPGAPPFAAWQAAADRRLFGLEATWRFGKAH